MGRVGSFLAWLLATPWTETVMRDGQGNPIDPAALETDESEDLKELDNEQTERRKWRALTRPRRSVFGMWRWPR